MDITRHEITWTIEGNPANGVYANGDPWVVGPITIINITPQSTFDGSRTKHGSMINPAPYGNQGFDSAMAYNGFTSSLNVGRPNGNNISAGNPLVVTAGKSLISTRSNDTVGKRPQLLDASVLTVVSSAPPVGSFRPPFCGTDKTHNWNISQIDWTKIPSLAPVVNTPALAVVESLVDRLALDLGRNGSDSRYCTPSNNMSSYGSAICANRDLALLSICLNYTQGQKQNLLVYLLQIGIDEYGKVANGMVYLEGGNVTGGRKAQMVLAAHILNSSIIQSYCGGNLKIFHEDRQSFIVQPSDVGRQMYTADGKPRETYTSAHIGLAEWGEQHTRQIVRDDSRWGASYREQNFHIGRSLVMRLIGARTLWNWTPFFDYEDRVWSIEASKPTISNKISKNDSGVPGIQAFCHAMYSAYRSLGDGGGGTVPDPAVTQPTILPSERGFLGSIEITISTPFPEGATVRYTLDGTDPTESSTLYTGPFTITETVQIKARGFAEGYFDSLISNAFFTNRYFTSTSNWVSISFPSESGTNIPVSLNATPSVNSLDGVIGLGNIFASAYSQLACIIQFATDGTVKARNGGAYQAINVFNYSAGIKYSIEMTVNVPAKTYSATITAPNGSPVIIATDYAFRTEQNTIGEINYFSSVVAGANNILLEDIYVGNFTPPTPQVSIPTISPQSGPYYNHVDISISDTTQNSSIYYTLDGTNPTTGSFLYSSNINITGDTTLKAIAIKSGYNDSIVANANYTINNFTFSDDDWTNMNLGEWFNDSSVQFDIAPLTGNVDAVFGLGPSEASSYGNLAVNFRLATGGNIEARNGDTYEYANYLPYSGNVKYSFDVTVDMNTKTYSASISSSGLAPTIIANNYNFRTDQAAANKIGYVSAIAVSTGIFTKVENVKISLYNQIQIPNRHFIKRGAIRRRRR